MLELRPICENCATDLPPDSTAAVICSFECTFCRDCATALHNVCPNCGGGFCERPVRPRSNWKDGNDIANFPPATERRHRPVDLAVHGELVRRVGSLAAERR
jgi:hypothetical protein